MKLRFNEARADAAAAFFDRRLHLTMGRWSGVRFKLEKFQRDDIVRPIFGNERFDEELGKWVRRYRRAWIELPKKTGKSPLGAGIALQGMHADGEASPEVYSVASTKRQAGIVFGIADRMTGLEPALANRSEVYRSKLAHHGVIHTPGNNGFYRVIPADAGSNDGMNPSRVVIDEVHRIANRELIDLIDESLAAREEPLIVYITTAGVDDPTSIAWELHDYAIKVRDGIIDDPYFFSYILGATAEETDGDGWKNEKLWRRVNPAIGSFNPSMITDLRAAAKAAEASPAKVAGFKRLRLNVWLPPSVTARNALLDLRMWDQGAGLIDKPGLKGREVYAGLDMASSEDMAALVGVLPNVGGCRNKFCKVAGEEACFDLIAHFWIPAAVLESESRTWTKGMIPTLQSWAAEGWIQIIDGEVIDDRDVHQIIDRWRRDFELLELAKDPYQSKQLGILLDEEGLTVYDHGQGMERMSEPTKRMIRHVRAKRVHHGGNPVLRWMVGNALARTDTNENMRPDRKNSTGKIDGIIGLILGLAAAERDEEAGDVFGFSLGGATA